MESSEPRRLASLPGYDTAPDIYETPDLTDDTSTTTLQTSPRSPSPSTASSDDEADGDADDRSFGVSRRRLYPDRARSRFAATSGRVETKNVDLSDRVDGRRRGYKVRRAPTTAAAAHHGLDAQDDSLDARIARLRREIEECRAEVQEGAKTSADDTEQDIDGLSRLLKEVETSSSSSSSAAAAFHDRSRRTGRDAGEVGHGTRLETRGASELTDEQTLSKVTDFDARLAALESALGISALDSSGTDTNAFTTPLLPSLVLLDQQFSAITSSASLASLDVASSRIDKLRRQAAELAAHAGQARPRSGSRPSSSSNAPANGVVISPEDTQKLQSLYTLIPTLQSLAPTVPAMLERLRSLRALHTSAATANADLDEVEKRQAEMDKELALWKAGIEKVENAIRHADEANGKNGKVVEGWVRDLEGRVKSLG